MRFTPGLDGKRILVAMLASLALGAAGCGRDHPEAGARKTAVPVQAVTAEQVSWPARLEVTAGVLPLRRAMPGTVLMGRVQQVIRREGDRVAAGAVLARIESRDQSARLAQAEAAVTAARAMAENARLNKERIERLQGRQAASRKNLDDATAAWVAAAANLEAAEEGVKAAQVYVAHGDVTAPFAGVVVEKRVEAGDMAAPGMPLFVVEDLSRAKIEAEVPESALAALAVGGPVEVEVAGSVRRGTLSEILPAADPRSRTFTVRVLLDNPGMTLRSGMFARLLIPGEARQALAVPGTALVRQGPLVGLFVVDDGNVARLRWVTVGATREEQIEVLTGLAPGERIVSPPPEGLQDGTPVRVD
jgi:multidrug efflux system membrane fusion protein